MIGWKEDDFRWRLHVGMTFTTFVFIYGLLAQDPDLMYLRHTHNLVPLEQRVLEVLVMFRNGYSQSALTPFTGQGHAKKIIPKSQTFNDSLEKISCSRKAGNKIKKTSEHTRQERLCLRFLWCSNLLLDSIASTYPMFLSLPSLVSSLGILQLATLFTKIN